MATLEESVSHAASTEVPARAENSLLNRMLKLFCSVRLGVALLIALGLACLIGMLVMQQNVDGFDRYFAELTPSQRLVYGYLGFFDIYHAWYFNALLAVLSLISWGVIFWTWTYPANAATSNWTMVPPNWEALRTQWEYSHAASACFNVVAIVALTLSVLSWRHGDRFGN